MIFLEEDFLDEITVINIARVPTVTARVRVRMGLMANRSTRAWGAETLKYRRANDKENNGWKKPQLFQG